MKKILSYILVAFVAINITSCSKDDDDTSVIANVNFKLPEELLVGATASSELSGGNNTYVATSSDKNVAIVSVDGKTLKVTAVSQGTTTIKVVSAGKEKSATIVVTPSLTTTGVYKLDGSLEFVALSEVKKGNTSFGFFEKYNPTQGKKVVVDLLDNPEVGATVTLNITSRDVANLSGSVSAKVENVSASIVQLKTDNYRLVIPKK